MQDSRRQIRPGVFRGFKDLKKLAVSMKEAGPLGAIKKVGHVLTWRLHTQLDSNFDDKFGVDTSSHVCSWDLDMKSEGGDIGTEEPMYLPTSSLAFRGIMANLPRDLSDYTFVDFGSGKGRTLLLASESSFKKIIGVEFATELHEAAERNVAAYKNNKQQCFEIECVLADATIYDLPDGPCVHYFFNPFEEDVMRAVVLNIKKSYENNPRKMYLVYYKPKFPELFLKHDFIKECPTRKLGIPNPYGLMIFETK